MARSEKTDLRQVKSRAALFDALDAMLGETPYGELTVIDLVARAGVGRQTFYRHFTGIDAMLEARLRLDLAEQMAVAQTMATSAPVTIWLERLAAFAFERAAQKPRLYRLILSGQAGDDALRLFRDQIGHMVALAADHPAFAPYTHWPAPLITSFYAGGISALLLSWLEAGTPLPPEEMGRMFVALSGALDRGDA